VLEVEPKARMFMRLVGNAFNYNVLGARAFRMLTQVVDACQCYRFSYSRLEQAVALFDALEAPGSNPDGKTKQ